MKFCLKFSTIILSLVVSILSSSCHESETQPGDPASIIDTSMNLGVRQYVWMNQFLPDTLFPRSIDPDGILLTNNSSSWTSGFFPGSLWYLYEYSGDDRIRQIAVQKTLALAKEQWNRNDHDIGFRINCSYGNAYRITGDSSYRGVLLNAATSLVTRFNPRVGCLRSWGSNDDTAHFLVIIDNMMNLELLFKATALSSDSSFFKIAVSHADVTLKNHFRRDGSSYHVVDYDPLTGRVQDKHTAQGYSDASAWARGQAWGLYGYTMCYRETGYERYLEQAEKIAAFILNSPNLPRDKVPYWDFNAPNIPNAQRDASAASIIASALEELAGFVQGGLHDQYSSASAQIIGSLSSTDYRSTFGDNGNFLLKHCVGSFPANSEVNVPLIFADYYYIEAMMRWREKENQKNNEH